MEREWPFSLIPLTIGTFFLGVGVHGLRRAGALRRTGVSAEARIIRHDVRRDDGSTFTVGTVTVLLVRLLTL